MGSRETVIRRLVVPICLILVCASSPRPARADERETSQRTARLLADLPAPAKAQGFEYRCYVLREGAPYGRLTLSAYPESQGARTLWRVREAIDPLRPGGERVVSQALLSSALEAVEGRYNRRNAAGYIQAVWKRSADGRFEVEHKTQDYENELRISSDPATTTLSAVLLFLRQVPAKPAVYSLPDFDPNPAAGDEYVQPLRIEVLRTARWKVHGGVRPAWIVSLRRGTQDVRLALDVKTRAFLGAEYIGLPFQFVPEGSGPVGLADPARAGLETMTERAVRRARALRAALPAPAAGFRFEGDLRLGDTRVGEVVLEAEPTSFDGSPAWRVRESRTQRTGEAVVRSEITGFLGQDLRVLRGERSDQRPAGSAWSTYVRTAGGMETVRTVDGKRSPATLLAAPEDAVAGLVPVLLFLRAVPLKKALYVLPGFNPRLAGPPKAGTGSLAFNRAAVVLDVRPGVPFEHHGVRRPGLRARCIHRTGYSYDVYLEPDSRELMGVVGKMPALSYLPHDDAAQDVTWYDAVETAPRSARQVFVKFGRGYHLPRRDLLADAIHWPSLKAQAVASGRYAKDTPEEKIREDWIDVFVGMSKHRTKGDCDDLLFQIFMTMEETTHEDGSITIKTLPVYGGHAYRCKQLGDRWYIVAID